MRRKDRVVENPNLRHVKTDKMAIEVERMVFLGLDVTEISYITGISVVSLKDQYAEELENGSANVIHQLGGAQIRAALRGDSMAAQFLLRARARWVTPTKQEIDANVTITDKRKVMDEIMAMMLKARERGQAPVLQMQRLIEAKPDGKPS